MNVYVRRNEAGKVDLVSADPYEDENGAADEVLADDDPDVVAFRSPPPVTVLYPVDLWSRLTDAEADAVESEISTQSVRIQNIFRTASSFRSDHELWPLLQSIAVSLFGEQRASEILEAS